MPNVVTERVCISSEDDKELRRGPWTLEEDTLLIHYIACHGEGRWNLVAKSSGLKRTGKSCRLRWLNYLKPDVKRGNLTPQEQNLILELHSKWGNRWSRIAKYLPGRTDNEIKNYWRTRVHKQARDLNIDSNCTRFRDAIRSFWIPRLLQKMESSSSTPALILNHTPHVPPEALQASIGVSELTNSYDHPMINQSSVNFTSSSISVLDSFNNISQHPEIPEYPTNPQALGSIVYNPFQNACYYADSGSYDMETFNLESMSSTPGDIDNWVYHCHMAKNNLVEDDVADSLWDMDGIMEI